MKCKHCGQPQHDHIDHSTWEGEGGPDNPTVCPGFEVNHEDIKVA